MNNDPWYYYRKEINSLKVLTHEETTDLFKLLDKVKEKLEQEQADVNIQKKNFEKIRGKIAEGNLRLVINIARNFITSAEHLKLIDLIQEGNLGLLKAIDKFDYKKGFRFSTYARWWIFSSIIQAVYNNGFTIKMPIVMKQILGKMEKAKKILEKETNNEVKNDDIDEALIKSNILSREKINALRNSAISEPMFLEDFVETRKCGEDGENFLALKDLIECDASQIPENNVLEKDKKEKIRQLLTIITPKEEEIIRRHLGIGLNEEETLKEIGDSLGGLCRERIRQLEKLAFEKIKTSFLAIELYDMYYR